MKEQDIIAKVVTLLTNNFPSFNVQTVGTDEGDGEVSLPALVVKWDTERRSEYQGHDGIAGYTRDTNGDVTGAKYQRYHRMELDIEVKSKDEGERDVTLSDVQDLFLPFERDSGRFHSDTFEWEVGSVKPRNNPVIEPDWYQAGITVRLRFVHEVVDNDVDVLEAVNETISNDLDL